MSEHKIFLIVTNCLGINFGKLGTSALIIGLIIFILHIWQIFIVILYPMFFEAEDIQHFIFKIMSHIQESVPNLLNLTIIFRAFKLRKLHKKLSLELKSKFTQKMHKNEKNYLKKVGFVVLIRIVKFLFGWKKFYFIYNFRVCMAELIYTSNDLLFIYYVEMLIEYLEYIDLKIFMVRNKRDLRQIRRDILQVFWLKIDLEKCFSIDLWLTITYNFILCIISFYWVMVRIIFHHLESISGWATFLHFIIPFYIYWSLFATCEKFTKKVKKISIVNK